MHCKFITILCVFVLAFCPFVHTKQVKYDNSQNSKESKLKTDLTPCVFEITEHFVLEKDDASARMHLSSSKIFKQLLDHLVFLSKLQPDPISVKSEGQWKTKQTFSNIFRYTQLKYENTIDLNLCTSFLFIRNDNATVCKLGEEIRFSAQACSALVNKLVVRGRLNLFNKRSFQQTLLALPQGKMFTFVQSKIEEVQFPNVNSESDFCEAIIDPSIKANLENIFISSAVMFKNYEELLETFFPQPTCQKFTFELPSSILPGLHLYKMFPRILALFMNKHLRFEAVCAIFDHNNTAPALPSHMQPTLQMFNQVFLSIKTTTLEKRVKRSSFNRFFEYVFGDADGRLKSLESYAQQELQMVIFLIDKSNETDLAIRHDEDIIANLFEDIKIEQLRVVDLTLKINLQQLSNYQENFFQIYLNHLQNFKTIYSNILLEFKTSIDHDLIQLTQCVQNKQFCFQQHKQLHCANNCFLTVNTNFFLNFHLLSYKKLEIFHAQCLHTLAGQISLLDNKMFMKNGSHFNAIKHELSIPIQCANQTQNNNIECKPYFSNERHNYILTCRNNQVVGTGNISLKNPKLENIKLSFVPKVINPLDFPIQISNQQIFADQICGKQDDFLFIPRQKFSQFHDKSPTFLFNLDPVHNVSFQTNFIYSTLKKIQRVKAKQIVEVAQSKAFLFSCILAVIVLTSILSCCFCPTLFLNMIQCILKGFVQFFAYLLERIVNIMSISYEMLCNMYIQHRSNTLDQRDNEIPPHNQLTSQTGNQQILENQTENESFIPFSPTSMTTVVSLPVATTSPPSPQLQSTAQKTLRFLNMPVRARRSESSAQRTEPAAQSVISPTAPSPTFMYRDMPGTPRRLF